MVSFVTPNVNSHDSNVYIYKIKSGLVPGIQSREYWQIKCLGLIILESRLMILSNIEIKVIAMDVSILKAVK